MRRSGHRPCARHHEQSWKLPTIQLIWTVGDHPRLPSVFTSVRGRVVSPGWIWGASGRLVGGLWKGRSHCCCYFGGLCNPTPCDPRPEFIMYVGSFLPHPTLPAQSKDPSTLATSGSAFVLQPFRWITWLPRILCHHRSLQPEVFSPNESPNSSHSAGPLLHKKAFVEARHRIPAPRSYPLRHLE